MSTANKEADTNGSQTGMGQHNDSTSDANSTRQQARKPAKNYIRPTLARLRALPELRPIPWKTGHELPVAALAGSCSWGWRRVCLLSTRGSIAETECSDCSRGGGRFSLCVTLDPFYGGACSNCVSQRRVKHCSLRSQTSGIAFALYLDGWC
jgi:hypothetical protein